MHAVSYMHDVTSCITVHKIHSTYNNYNNYYVLCGISVGILSNRMAGGSIEHELLKYRNLRGTEMTEIRLGLAIGA